MPGYRSIFVSAVEPIFARGKKRYDAGSPTKTFNINLDLKSSIQVQTDSYETIRATAPTGCHRVSLTVIWSQKKNEPRQWRPGKMHLIFGK
jgi:hypothetical protein